MTFNVGDRIGDYEIVSVLGAGGMGKVYKVRNVISDRVEAMKILLPNLESDPELADRFMREIKVQGSLDHPNIAGLHTAQRLNNQLVMIMEYVEGETLEQKLHAGSISLQNGIDYISQVLSALSYAHARGVIHRDIKPANMMLTTTGIVKLMDFGIAKLSADPKLTQTGRTVGSLYYMSPEQINGANLDARSDLYSLGVSLYEIVTGTRPFKGDSDFSIMAAHLNSVPVAPLQIDPRLPSMLNEIIMMSLARDPAQRFQSADAFRNALQSLAGSLGMPASAQQAAPAPRATAQTMAPESPVAAQVVGTAAPKSRRGLYMAIGSLATVCVVVLAAIEGPKWFQPSGASAPVQASLTTATQAPVPAPQPLNEQAQTQEQGTTPVRAAEAPAATTVRPDRITTAPVLPAPALARSTAAPARSTAVMAQAPQQQMPVQAAPQQQLPPVAQQAAHAPEASHVDAAKTAALQEHRESLMMLGTRANSVKGSLHTLQQQQARSGLNLRADMVTAQQRMEFYLDEAESSLKAGDPGKMKKNLDSAEREIEKLEKFLGH